MHGAAADLGTLLPVWSAIPFAGILLSIALLPLLAPAFWHHHFARSRPAWALLFAVPFVLALRRRRRSHELLHVAIVDYVPFLILSRRSSRSAAASTSRDRCAARRSMNAR